MIILQIITLGMLTFILFFLLLKNKINQNLVNFFEQNKKLTSNINELRSLLSMMDEELKNLAKENEILKIEIKQLNDKVNTLSNLSLFQEINK